MLASSEDVEDLVRLYNALFLEVEDPYDDPPLEAMDETVQRCLQDIDLGVEKESRMDSTSLSTALGFVNNQPFLFNPSRHKAGFNPWDNPEAFDQTSSDFSSHDIVRTSLHWHQIAGVHSIFRTVFSSDIHHGKRNCKGVLVADEVGLGKTAMVITVLATLSHLIWLQENKRPLPPLFRK
jgi:TATA-binding protein-associated factor